MKIAVVGASGRMGQMLVRQIARTEGVTLAAASERPGSKALGQDAGEIAGIEPNGVMTNTEVLSGFVTQLATVATLVDPT